MRIALIPPVPLPTIRSYTDCMRREYNRDGLTHKVLAREYLVVLEGFVCREAAIPRIRLRFFLDTTYNLCYNVEL